MINTVEMAAKLNTIARGIEAGGNGKLYVKAIQEIATALEDAAATRWQHKKRGSTYIEIGRGRLQAVDPGGLSDLQPMVIYISEAGGSLWVRPADEFEDGRFERLADGA